jgi:ketosteroid isomerase-like protein
MFSSSAAAKNPNGQKKPDYKREVESLEEHWRIVQLNNDVAEMDRLLSDDYIGITMNGQVVTKAQLLARMRTRQLTVKQIELNDVKVKLIGSTAIVTSEARVDGSSEGVPVRGMFRYTRIYTRLPNGVWKITNFEATPEGGSHRRESANE